MKYLTVILITASSINLFAQNDTLENIKVGFKSNGSFLVSPSKNIGGSNTLNMRNYVENEFDHYQDYTFSYGSGRGGYSFAIFLQKTNNSWFIRGELGFSSTTLDSYSVYSKKNTITDTLTSATDTILLGYRDTKDIGSSVNVQGIGISAIFGKEKDILKGRGHISIGLGVGLNKYTIREDSYISPNSREGLIINDSLSSTYYLENDINILDYINRNTTYTFGISNFGVDMIGLTQVDCKLFKNHNFFLGLNLSPQVKFTHLAPFINSSGSSHYSNEGWVMNVLLSGGVNLSYRL